MPELITTTLLMTKRDQKNPTDNNRRRVQGWLLDRYEHVTQIDTPDTIWQLTAKDHFGHGLAVANLVAKPHLILAQISIALMPNYQNAFNSLSPKERSEFLCEVQLRLLSMDVDYSGVDEPLELIIIEASLSLDGLNRDTLLQRAACINRAGLSVLIMLNRRLGGDHQRPTDTASVTIH